MTYIPHELVAFGGTLGAGTDADIWECTIRGQFNVVLSSAQRTAWLTSFAADLRTYWPLATSTMRSDAALTYAKCNAIDANGHYSNPSQTYTVGIAAVTGGSAVTYPAFMSTVWSWYTDNLRGTASKGRMYPPNSSSPLAAGSSRISGTAATSAVTAAKNFMAVLMASRAGVYLGPTVESKVGSGNESFIRGVRVGNVYDLQRRRKNALTEVYVTSTIP